MLRKEVKLYEGKIGCGSCHNIYSKEKYMLVISNDSSVLCLECHLK
jgi:predicted CXXCH cytochrome family protein